MAGEPMPVLAVLSAGDSFASVWPELARSAAADLRVAADAASLAPLRTSCAALVVLPGEEHRVEGPVGELLAAGAAEVAVIGAAAEHRVAVSALRAGATEYFALPADLEALRRWTEAAAERWRSARRAETLAAEERARYDFSRIIGRSSGLAAALERASRIIPRANATVLLTGETGTGKELLAQAIHYNGPRASEPFVEINCSALPPTLLEAELFGHEAGAFTDAKAARAGLFEAAHGGTLFLDEIGDLQPELQAKLLKVLEDREVRRLGSVRTIAIDVRIVAATHVDLEAAVRAGSFREDLYYRLNVVPIHLPPLRDRDDDVLLLAEHFVAEFAAEYDLPRLKLTNEVRRALLGHSWPGNIRELRNSIQRAALLGGGALSADDLFMRLPRPILSGVLPFPAGLAEIERAAARAMVELHAGNKKAAAAALGVSRSTLYRLLDPGAEA